MSFQDCGVNKSNICLVTAFINVKVVILASKILPFVKTKGMFYLKHSLMHRWLSDMTERNNLNAQHAADGSAPAG